jgi:hypothetical protein
MEKALKAQFYREAVEASKEAKGEKVKAEVTGVEKPAEIKKKREVGKYVVKETDTTSFVESRDRSGGLYNMTQYSAKHLDKAGIKAYRLGDYDAGFAVHPDGEVVNGYNNSGVPNLGTIGAIDAIANKNGKHGNNFDGHLTTLWGSIGFEEVRRVKWDDKLAPEGWNYKKYGKPEVVYNEFKQNTSDPRILAGMFEALRGKRLDSDPRAKEVLDGVYREAAGKTRGKVDVGKPAEIEGRISRDLKGVLLNNSLPTYDKAVVTTHPGRNVYIKKKKTKTNKDRTLLVQVSSRLHHEEATGLGEKYFDKLYSTRSGYKRGYDFWEIPTWIANAAKTFPKSDVYVVRNIEEAKLFFKAAEYDNVMFSVMDSNKDLVKRTLEGYDGNVMMGGYVEPGYFKDLSNVKFHGDIESAAKSVGVNYKVGVDYSHFKDTEVIPRQCYSEGCKHSCSFCTVPKKVVAASIKEIDQQVDALKDLDFKLVYLNDKTFGQSPKYDYITSVYDKIKAKNPEFEGFIVQTTAGRLLKFSDEFLQKSGIRYVELGVETYNDKFLRRIKKPASEKVIDAAVEKLRKNKINFVPNIMVGLAGATKEGKIWSETPATYKRTLDFLEKNKDIISHVNVYNTTLYEGTELAEQLGIKLPTDQDENIIKKSWHKDPKHHEKFYQDVIDFGMRALDKPAVKPFVRKVEKPDIKPDIVSGKAIPGLAYKKGFQTPIRFAREIKRGANEGKVQVTWPNGKKSIIEKKDIIRMPGEARPEVRKEAGSVVVREKLKDVDVPTKDREGLEKKAVELEKDLGRRGEPAGGIKTPKAKTKKKTPISEKLVDELTHFVTDETGAKELGDWFKGTERRKTIAPRISKKMLESKKISGSLINQWKNNAKTAGVSNNAIEKHVQAFKDYNAIIKDGSYILLPEMGQEALEVVVREGVLNTAAISGIRRGRLDQVYADIEAGEKRSETGRIVKGGKEVTTIPKGVRGKQTRVHLNVPITVPALSGPRPKGLNYPVVVTGNPHMVDFKRPHKSWDKVIKVVRVKPVFKGTKEVNKAVIDAINYANEIGASILVTSFRARQPWALAKFTDIITTDPEHPDFNKYWKKNTTPRHPDPNRAINHMPYMPKQPSVSKAFKKAGWDIEKSLFGEGGTWWWPTSRELDPSIVKAIDKNTKVEYCDLLHKGCPTCRNCQKLTYPESKGAAMMGVTDEPYCKHGCPQCFVRLGQSGVKGRKDISFYKNAKQSGYGEADLGDRFSGTVNVLQRVARDPSRRGITDYVSRFLLFKEPSMQVDMAMNLYLDGLISKKEFATIQKEVSEFTESRVLRGIKEFHREETGAVELPFGKRKKQEDRPLEWPKAPKGTYETGEVVKHRKKGKDKVTGKDLYAPEIHEGERDIIKALKEYKGDPTAAVGMETAHRGFDKLGKEVKELIYWPAVEANDRMARERKAREEDIKALGQGLSDKNWENVGLYMIANQEGGKARLKNMGFPEDKIPSKLTPEEEVVRKGLRKRFKILLNRANKARRLSGKQSIPERKAYFTFMHDVPALERMGFSTGDQFAKMNTTPFRFAKARGKMGSYPMEFNARVVFDRYAEIATKHIHLSPHIAKSRELLNTFSEPTDKPILDEEGSQIKFKSGPKKGQVKTEVEKWKLADKRPAAAKFLTDWLNHQAGQVSTGILGKEVDGIATVVNQNLAFAVLSANVRSAAIQPSAIIHTGVEIGVPYTLKGIKTILDPKNVVKNVKEAMAKSNHLASRIYDVSVNDALVQIRKGKIGAAKKKAAKWGLAPLQGLDMITAVATWQGAYIKGKEAYSMSEKEAIRFADDVVIRTQASAMPTDIAPIQRTALGKSLTLFNTFVISEWNWMMKDVFKTGKVSWKYKKARAMKKSHKEAVKAAMTEVDVSKILGLIAGVTAVNVLFEDLMGITSPYPGPIRAFSEAVEEDDTGIEAVLAAAKEMTEVLPVVGGAMRYGSHPGGAALEFAGEVTEKIAGKPWAKPWLVIGGKAVGVTGTQQIHKYVRGAKRGESIYGRIMGVYTKKPKKSTGVSRRRRSSRRRNRRKR